MIPDGVVSVTGPKVFVVLIRWVDAGTFVAGSAITGTAASVISKTNAKTENAPFLFILFHLPFRSLLCGVEVKPLLAAKNLFGGRFFGEGRCGLFGRIQLWAGLFACGRREQKSLG